MLSFAQEEGWKYFFWYVFVCLLYNTNFMNTLKCNDFFKCKKKFIDYSNCVQSTKSPHFLHRKKVGQLCKRRRVLWLSILLVYGVQYSIYPNKHIVYIQLMSIVEPTIDQPLSCHVFSSERGELLAWTPGSPADHLGSHQSPSWIHATSSTKKGIMINS